MVPGAESVCQSEQVGELRDADGLRVNVVFVNWGLVWTTRSVADVVFQDEFIEPSSGAKCILGAVIRRSIKSVFVYLASKKGYGKAYTAQRPFPGNHSWQLF